MRFKHLLSEEQLDEIRMSPGALRKFAQGPEAEGIRAGFEAELVFTGLGTDDDQEWEPDYDADERAYSIQQVVEFFQNDEWGYGMSDREADRLQEKLDEFYYEWYDDQVRNAFREEAEDLVRELWEEEFDREFFIKEYLKNELGLSDDEVEEAEAEGRKAPRFTRLSDQDAYKEMHPGYERWLEANDAADTEIEELVEKSVNQEDEYWENAFDNFRDNYSIDDDSGFFSDQGWRWMSDIANHFDLMWPVMSVTGSGEGSFDYSNAQNLAADLEEKLGVKTKVSSGYHSATRDEETWIFEPDSSLDSDDSDNMPVEIVSPPMPLGECLAKIKQFFEWAEDNGAYSNSSTGFHMGVSLPHTGGSVDYLKLALFLGDEYVLREFGRSANRFTEAAMKRIRQRVKGSDVEGAMELMKHNLIELAQKQLEINNHGFGKYTSINPQGGVDSTRVDQERPAKYIEFRSAGGTNYFEDIEKLQNTLMRYARAMSIAANPAAERREYYTKLYKLLTPAREATGGVELFTEYAAGKISKDELKKRWAEAALAKDAPELTQKSNWVVVDKNTGNKVQGQEYNNYTKTEAEENAKAKLSPGSSDTDFKLNYEVVPQNTGKWEVYDVNNDDQTLEIVDAETRGQAVDQVSDKYNSQSIPFKVRPYYGDYAKNKPAEPKLTRRAQLAKRIKQPQTQTQYNYDIIDRRSLNLKAIDRFYAANDQEASDIFNRWLKMKNLPNDTDNYGYRKSAQAAHEPRHNWKIVRLDNGATVDTLQNASEFQARAEMQDVIRRYNLQAGQLGLQIADSNVQDIEPNVAQNFSQPQQARTASGVPMWEVYQRDNGHVVHTFADHNQQSAWSQGQEWLRSVGAEPSAYSDFSVRPKMTTNETVDPVSGRGAVTPGPITMTKPQSQVKPVDPAVKVDIKDRQPDPYAFTYKKLKEWEDIVESMIRPAGRLGQ